MSFSFEIWSTFVFLLFVSKLSQPKFWSIYTTVVGYMLVICLNIKMVLIFRTWSLEKRLLEIYRFNVLTDIVGVIKTNLGELKIRFILTASIHIVRYIRNYFHCWEVSKGFLYLKYYLHSCSSYFFKSYHLSTFDQLTRV
jgi:hypothetical protein